MMFSPLRPLALPRFSIYALMPCCLYYDDDDYFDIYADAAAAACLPLARC